MNYDLIVVGSGNGACGFLSKYLQSVGVEKQQILVLEEGENFFNTGNITHQNNWTKSYAEREIFKLHNAVTKKGTPVITGRAHIMGGGGSINYSMIHESNSWLTENIGRSTQYWDDTKESLNRMFHRKDSRKSRSPLTCSLLEVLKNGGFHPSTDFSENIPNLSLSNTGRGVFHEFPTQFNVFGQRTNSGVSLIDWTSDHLEIKTHHRVSELLFQEDSNGKKRCIGAKATHTYTGATINFLLKPENGKIVMCAGAGTPQILMHSKEALQNVSIGKGVSDHILIPLGIYVLRDNVELSGRDVYQPVFATNKVSVAGSEVMEGVYSLEFFAGTLERLIFFMSHLYLAILLPNIVKTMVVKYPSLFSIIKKSLRVLLEIPIFLFKTYQKSIRFLTGGNVKELKLITAIVKFNPVKNGSYHPNSSKARIQLDFFSETESGINADQLFARKAIEENLDMINQLGDQPSYLIRLLMRVLVGFPYYKNEVSDFVHRYSKAFLLSQQHLAGGCLFGSAIGRGDENHKDTGKLNGCCNVFVADLSAAPLPRVSTQMTAYLIGYHVAQSMTD